MEYPSGKQYFDLPACMGWQIIWFWCMAEWKQNTAEQFILISVKQRRGTLVFYPTITMCEHLCDIVWFKISKTFLGKIITAADCLHSFQGLFYYSYCSYFGRIFYYHGKRGSVNNSKSLATQAIEQTARNNYVARYSLTSTERVVIWLEKASRKKQDSRIYPSDIDEHQKSSKQYTVMFETPGRMFPILFYSRTFPASTYNF